MKTFNRLALFLFLFSCGRQENDELKYLQVKVEINDKLSRYLEYPEVVGQKISNIVYDSASHRIVSVFDSVKSGKKSIFVFSLLTDNFNKRVELHNDTLISFETNQYNNLKIESTRGLSAVPKNIDTLFIGQRVRGCFSGYAEKFFIYKVQDNYLIKYSRNNAPLLTSERIISDVLFNLYFSRFLSECYKIAPNSIGGLTISHFSTTKTETYIRLGNAVYEIPDVLDWKGYSIFKENIGISLMQDL